MNTEEFIRRFKWTADKKESWRILKDATPRRFEGDCDDFACTVLWLECGQSMFKFWWKLLTLQAVIWMGKLPNGQLHALLWLKGRGWIDNTSPKWAPKASCRKILPYPLPVVKIKMML